MVSSLPNGLVTTAICGLIGTITLVWWWRRSKKETVPTSWRKLAGVVELWIYPVKSLGGVSVDKAELSTLGLRVGKMRDRYLMVVDEQGTFITARAFPVMTTVHPHIEDNKLTLTASGHDPITIDLHDRNTDRKPVFNCEVWGQPVDTIDLGDEVATWISRAIMGTPTGARLVSYRGEVPVRPVRAKNLIFPLLHERDSGAFPDVTAYMLINEASIDDMNVRVNRDIIPMQFRPNIVIRGAQAYDEDNWRWVRIGDEDGAVFQVVKPCTRCVFTTIDPEKGEKDPDGEPLKTLKTYRQPSRYVQRKCGNSPVMGIHLALVSGNGQSLKVGMPLYVSP